MVISFAGASVPEGWLDCDATAVSRTTYGNLFAAVGTAYGGGDGGTTFNLPDFRGRSILGEGTGSGLTARARGDKAGVQSVSISANNLPQHTHAGGGNVGAESSHAHGAGTYAISTNSNAHTHSGSTDWQSHDHTHYYYNQWSGSGASGNSWGGSYIGQTNTTSGVTSNHYHPFTTGNNSSGANHDHTLSGSTAAGSSHAHSDPTTGNNTTTASNVDTISPFGVAKYIIKT
jgi:microcystin-dependent protein